MDREESEAELDYEKSLIKFYQETRLWTLDDRKPTKGFPHPVEKTCVSCPWFTQDNECKVAGGAASLVDGCPRPNFEDDLELVEWTIQRKDYAPLALNKDGKLDKKILGVEVFFDAELGGVPVRGYMDLVVEEDQDTLEVIDYKSGQKTLSYDAAFKDPQVRIYGAVARKLWPQYKSVLVTLHYLRKNPVTVDVGPRDDELTIKSLQNRYGEITENKNPYRRKIWLCRFCVGWEDCGKIHQAFTVDGKFQLPIISCAHADETGECWGGLAVENPKSVCPDNISKTKYTCGGHRKLHKGGEYVSEKAGDNKIS